MRENLRELRRCHRRIAIEDMRSGRHGIGVITTCVFLIRKGKSATRSEPWSVSTDHGSDGHQPRHSVLSSASQPHTRLYPLEPIGVGTPLVESVLSYLARLTEEHGVAPMQLIAQEIGPRVGKRYASDPRACPQFFGDWRHTLALCGSGPVAHDWTSALERLTGRRDLSHLTLASLDQVIAVPTSATLRRTGRWCPCCYEEWRSRRAVLYGPLIWMLGAADHCPVHHTPLMERCPNVGCRRTMSWLVSQAQRGYCLYCGSWLGANAQGEASASSMEIAPTVVRQLKEPAVGRIRQIGASENIGVLLAFAGQHDAVTRAHALREALSRWRDAMPTRVALRLRRCAGVTQRMLEEWSEGGGRPSLPQVLRLCRALEISAADFLWNDAPEIERQLASVDQRQKNHPGASKGLGNTRP